MEVFPAKTAKHIFRSSGRDFIGQQPIIQHIANSCLPSFTNATRRVRYYTFWAWAFEMYKRNEKAFKNAKEIKYYLLKLESALIICNKYIDPTITGMPGVTQIPFNLDFKSLKSDSSIKLVDGDRSATSYSAVQYKPSLGTLNIVSMENGFVEIRKFGEPLANVFDDEIREKNGYVELIDPRSDSIKWGKLKNLCDSFSLENLKPREIKLFIEIIEQSTIESGFIKKSSPRINTTLLVLDAIRKKPIYFKRDLATNIYFDRYKPHKDLYEVYCIFKIIEFRRYYQFAIENILSMFCGYLNLQIDKQGTFREFTMKLIRGLNSFKDPELLGSKFKLKINKSFTIADFNDSFSQKNIPPGFTEDAIYQKNRLLNKKYGTTYCLESAIWSVILIFKLYQRIEELKRIDLEHFRSFLVFPVGFKHSIEGLQKFIQSTLKLPLEEGINKIITELSLKLHLAVAQDKMLSQGNFTFRFSRAEPTGFYMLETMSANRTSNKIEAYIEILTDLGFIAIRKDYYVITNKGTEYLSKYLN